MERKGIGKKRHCIRIVLLTLRTLRKPTRSYLSVPNTIITVTLGATSSSVQYGTAITARCTPHTTLITLSTARLADEPSALTIQRAEPGNGLDQAGPGFSHFRAAGGRAGGPGSPVRHQALS